MVKWEEIVQKEKQTGERRKRKNEKKKMQTKLCKGGKRGKGRWGEWEIKKSKYIMYRYKIPIYDEYDHYAILKCTKKLKQKKITNLPLMPDYFDLKSRCHTFCLWNFSMNPKRHCETHCDNIIMSRRKKQKNQDLQLFETIFAYSYLLRLKHI